MKQSPQHRSRQGLVIFPRKTPTLTTQQTTTQQTTTKEGE
jgi:hypothetical protein